MKATKFFNKPANLEELKKQYKNLVKKYHPDLNPDKDTTEDMKRINAEYEILFYELEKNGGQGFSGEQQQETTETPEMFIEIINKLVNMDGLTIEIIGSWLWVTGNTYMYKEELKAAGMKWSKNKKAWYWHSGEYSRKGSKKNLDEIRNIYGSETVKAEKRKAIA